MDRYGWWITTKMKIKVRPIPAIQIVNMTINKPFQIV